MIGNLSSLQQIVGDSTPGVSVSVEDQVQCSSELALTKFIKGHWEPIESQSKHNNIPNVLATVSC